MATFVLTDAVVTIDGVDLSDHGNRIEVNYEAEAKDDTAFGDDTRSNAGGLKNWSMRMNFLQDFAASEVDATIWPLVGTVVTVTARATSAAKSSTNPSYEGSGLVRSYNPLGGQVGDMAAALCEIVPGGTLSQVTS